MYDNLIICNSVVTVLITNVESFLRKLKIKQLEVIMSMFILKRRLML